MNRLSIAGRPLKYFHICGFFSSRDEEYEVLTPFFKEALEQNEKNLHIVGPAMIDDHRRRLLQSGIDVPHCEACGQLEVVKWQDAYLNEDGVFEKEKMLATVEHLTGEGRDTGFHRLRIMGNMDWVFAGIPGAADILEYEAEVNEVLSRNQQPAVCVYDIAKLSGSMMMDLLRTHPLVLIGGVVQENPFYTPPAEMLDELKRRKEMAPDAPAELA